MKTIEEMTAVMQAFQEGKEIEYRSKSSKLTTWHSTEQPCWNWIVYDYRIKQEPKYRPYANADECFADIRKHGSWVKNTTGMYINILAIGSGYIFYTGKNSFSYKNAYSHLVWADDGTPCGAKEDENL